MKLRESLLLLVLCVCTANLATAKPPTPTKEYSPFEAAALGGIPTCCPTSPFLHCDFYFDGYKHSLPVYNLTDRLYGDHPLKTIYASKLKWKGWSAEFSPSLKDIKSGHKAYVGSTWMNGTFLQCKTLPKWINTDGQFFISNIGNVDGSKLFARRFQRATKSQHGLKFYRYRCILLPLTQISIPQADGTNLNLDLNDQNTDYPQSRRCVVFKTGK